VARAVKKIICENVFVSINHDNRRFCRLYLEGWPRPSFAFITAAGIWGEYSSSDSVSTKEICKRNPTRNLHILVFMQSTSENRLRVFEMSCLRRIAGVTRKDRIRNKEVCDRVGLLQDVANRLQQRRVQYFGHVQRMDHTRYPKLALHVHGTRRQGRPKKRWIDMVGEE